jgi:hypothetical protein
MKISDSNYLYHKLGRYKYFQIHNFTQFTQLVCFYFTGLFSILQVGGPALIFDRFQEAGVTTIGHKADTPVTQKILGLGKIFCFQLFTWLQKLITFL